MTDTEAKVVAAWKEAAADLAIRFTSPYVLTCSDGREQEHLGLVHVFGSPIGALIAVLYEPSERVKPPEGVGYFWSILGPGYGRYEGHAFIDTLYDWKFFGANSDKPEWYTGKSWGPASQVTSSPMDYQKASRMKPQLTSTFVCLSCRKVFKRPTYKRAGDHYQELHYIPRCPHCQAPLLRLGDAFRAPPKNNAAAWERVSRDIAKGCRFIRDEGFGAAAPSPNPRRTAKGIHSPFQLPARKRKTPAKRED